MGFLTHSQEIMYLSIAFGVLLIAVLMGWLLFYFVMIVRDTRNILTKAKETLSATHDVVTSLKKKIDDATIQFKFLFEGIKTVVDWIKSRKDFSDNHIAKEQGEKNDKK